MPRTYVSKDGAWEIDLTWWRRKDKNAFTKAMNEAGNTAIDDPLYPFMAKIVKRWPCAGTPSDVAGYEDLEFEEWEALLGHVTDAYKSYENERSGNGVPRSEGLPAGSTAGSGG